VGCQRGRPTVIPTGTSREAAIRSAASGRVGAEPNLRVHEATFEVCSGCFEPRSPNVLASLLEGREQHGAAVRLRCDQVRQERLALAGIAGDQADEATRE
jgi:hypothetical protein